MIEQLPTWIDVLFIASAIYTIAIFHYTNGKPTKWTFAITMWSVVHSLLAFSGFYHDTVSLPPRFALVIIPVFITLIITSINQSKSTNIRHNTLWQSTFIHIVRVPVEITLYMLYIHKMVPELMTFAGRNLDILAGLTAPIVAYFLYKNKLSRQAFLIWNIISLGLLLFIVINAILSVDGPLQQFAHDQPNRALAYFPYILLPATVAPLVMYTHLMDIFDHRSLGKK